MECPACGEEMSGDTCQCGYDRTQDYSIYPTLYELKSDERIIAPIAGETDIDVDTVPAEHISSAPNPQNQGLSESGTESEGRIKIIKGILFIDLLARAGVSIHIIIDAFRNEPDEVGVMLILMLLAGTFLIISSPYGFVFEYCIKKENVTSSNIFITRCFVAIFWIVPMLAGVLQNEVILICLTVSWIGFYFVMCTKMNGDYFLS